MQASPQIFGRTAAALPPRANDPADPTLKTDVFEGLF